MIRDKKGLWTNSILFSPAATHFKQFGYYTSAPEGSPEWYDYWHTERNRCINGYEVEGERITGYHYFYLNYTPIMRTIRGQKISSKIEGFPDFWDGDYNYFWVREIAKYGIEKIFGYEYDSCTDAKVKRLFASLRLDVDINIKDLRGGSNLIIGKGRRKGYSHKAASIGACNYFTRPNSVTYFGAYDKKYLYPEGLYSMCDKNIDFINSNTAWATPSDAMNKPAEGKRRASYYVYENGIQIEKGLKSSVICISFADDPDAGRGKSAEDFFIEEAGAFGPVGLLKKSIEAIVDTAKDGVVKTGMITVFGTSGNLTKDAFDYSDIFMNPEAHDFMSFLNNYDPMIPGERTGFFHPANYTLVGFYDENGNSDLEKARDYILEYRRDLIAKGASAETIIRKMIENPLSPREAFSSISSSFFPSIEIKKQLAIVKAKELDIKKGMPVELYYEGTDVKYKPKLGQDNRISSYRNVTSEQTGEIIMYEQPIYDAPRGLYKIGYDPVSQDKGSSLACIVVYKGVHSYSFTKNIIVADYIGRPDSVEDCHYIAMQLAELYNTKIMYENNVFDAKNYFRRLKKLYLLARQPNAVISKNIKDSKVERTYGCHMNGPLKDAGERYIKDWLLEVQDYTENENPVRALEFIYSPRLLEELLEYNRKGNFDYISALIMVMIQCQEESLGKVYAEKKEHIGFTQLKEMMPTLFSNNNDNILSYGTD